MEKKLPLRNFGKFNIRMNVRMFVSNVRTLDLNICCNATFDKLRLTFVLLQINWVKFEIVLKLWSLFRAFSVDLFL